LLKLQYLFLDGVLGDEAIGENLAGLADAVSAVDGLGFYGGVPPGIEEEDVLRGRQIQTKAAGFETDEKQLAVLIGLESIDALLAVAGFAVEVFVDGALIVQLFSQDRKEAGELGEDNGFVAFVGQFRKAGNKRVELGAGIVNAGFVEQAGMARGLAKTQESFEDLKFGFAQPDTVDSGRGGIGGNALSVRRREPAVVYPIRRKWFARIFREDRRQPGIWCGGE